MLPGLGLLVVLFTLANVIWWKGRYTKKGVLLKYRTFLARTLEVRGGPGPHYRSTDVTRAMLSSHVSTAFAPYAYAMFCNADEFRKAPNCSHLSYDELRKEVETFGIQLDFLRSTSPRS